MSLTLQQLKAIPRWVKINVRYTDFATNNTVNQINLYTLEPMEFVQAVKIVPTSDFAGGAIATYTLQVGGDEGNDVFCSPKDVFTGNTTATDITYPSVGVGEGIQSTSTQTIVTCDATSTGADLDQATAGRADIYLLVSTLPA